MAESVWDKHVRAIIHENFLALQETTSPGRNRRTFSVSSRTPAAGSASLDVLDKQQARHTRPKGTFQERVKAKEDKAKENEADRIRALEQANSALLQELAEARLRAPIKQDTGSSSKRACAHDADGSDDDENECRPRKAQKTRDEDFVPNSDDDGDGETRRTPSRWPRKRRKPRSRARPARANPPPPRPTRTQARERRQRRRERRPGRRRLLDPSPPPPPFPTSPTLSSPRRGELETRGAALH